MLKVRNIETWYDLIRALHGISFEVKQGDIIALLGSNGAGKTTTLKTIMRLLYNLKEEQPEKGTIEFLGTRIERKDTDQIVRMGISYVPEGREVFPELTVMENILMGAYTRKDKKGIKRRHRQRLPPFSHPEREDKTGSRLHERRGAADAGHRPGPDEPPQAPDAG